MIERFTTDDLRAAVNAVAGIVARRIAPQNGGAIINRSGSGKNLSEAQVITAKPTNHR